MTSHQSFIAGGVPSHISKQARCDDELVAIWVARHESAHTRRNYQRQADKFRSFISKPIRTCRIGDVQASLSSLSCPAQATRANATSTIRSLLSFAHEVGFTSFNVGRVIKAPPIKERLAERIIGEADIMRMIGREANPRNHALLTLLYGAGLRISEACSLRWRDLVVRENSGQITIYGKGGKTRVILVSPNTWKTLLAICGEREPDEAVFASRNVGRALDPSQVHRIVKAAAANAGLPPEISAHWLRHAHASHSLDRGAPISLVQSTLGHASVATTSRYLHARPSDSSARYLSV